MLEQQGAAENAAEVISMVACIVCFPFQQKSIHSGREGNSVLHIAGSNQEITKAGDSHGGRLCGGRRPDFADDV